MANQINPQQIFPTNREWFVESEEELQTLPSAISPGSTALILTSEGLTIKMKNSSGDWITV